MNQKRANQTIPLNLFFFALAVIRKKRTKEIIKRLSGSKKKLNVFERIKNNQLVPYYTVINKFFEGRETIKNIWAVAG